MRRADSFARANAGSSIPARMAMMAITTSSSIKVNARRAGATTRCRLAKLKLFSRFMALFLWLSDNTASPKPGRATSDKRNPLE